MGQGIRPGFRGENGRLATIYRFRYPALRGNDPKDDRVQDVRENPPSSFYLSVTGQKGGLVMALFRGAPRRRKPAWRPSSLKRMNWQPAFAMPTCWLNCERWQRENIYVALPCLGSGQPDITPRMAHEEAPRRADRIHDTHAQIAQMAQRQDVVGEKAIEGVGRRYMGEGIKTAASAYSVSAYPGRRYPGPAAPRPAAPPPAPPHLSGPDSAPVRQ